MKRKDAYRHYEEATAKISNILYGVSFSMIGILFLKSENLTLSRLELAVFCCVVLALLMHLAHYFYVSRTMKSQLDATYSEDNPDVPIDGFSDKSGCILNRVYVLKVIVFCVAALLFACSVIMESIG